MTLARLFRFALAPMLVVPILSFQPLPGLVGVIHAAPAVAASLQDSKDADPGTAFDKSKRRPVQDARISHPVLWHKQDIPTLDLFSGQGGTEHAPKAPFVFDAEDKAGTNPKFDVHDANGKKWRVKLGEEARPEVAASRLLWAMGYFVDDDYVLQEAEVAGLHLHRGSGLAKDGRVENARFSRKPIGQKKIGIWKWKENPFMGTREFNGLRVMMAVMNNWDLKDENNAVYNDAKSNEQMFLVSDIGASFGSNGLGLSKERSKGNLESFRESKFITKITEKEVSFATPAAPTSTLVASFGFSAKQYASRHGMAWIGNNLPVEDVRWIGKQLAQLSHAQLVDAFRAGGFPPADIDAYVHVVESRITELKQL